MAGPPLSQQKPSPLAQCQRFGSEENHVFRFLTLLWFSRPRRKQLKPCFCPFHPLLLFLPSLLGPHPPHHPQSELTRVCHLVPFQGAPHSAGTAGCTAGNPAFKHCVSPYFKTIKLGLTSSECLSNPVPENDSASYTVRDLKTDAASPAWSRCTPTSASGSLSLL